LFLNSLYIGAIVAALENTNLNTGLSLAGISELSNYWEQARGLYYLFIYLINFILLFFSFIYFW